MFRYTTFIIFIFFSMNANAAYECPTEFHQSLVNIYFDRFYDEVSKQLLWNFDGTDMTPADANGWRYMAYYVPGATLESAEATYMQIKTGTLVSRITYGSVLECFYRTHTIKNNDIMFIAEHSISSSTSHIPTMMLASHRDWVNEKVKNLLNKK